MRYRLSTPANRDLRDIWSYISAIDPVAAGNVIDELSDRLLMLAAHPNIGRSCERFGAGLRRLSVGQYVVFYRFTGDQVEIARILHGARDMDSILQSPPE